MSTAKRNSGMIIGNGACAEGNVLTLLSKNMFQKFIGTAIQSVKLAINFHYPCNNSTSITSKYCSLKLIQINE